MPTVKFHLCFTTSLLLLDAILLPPSCCRLFIQQQGQVLARMLPHDLAQIMKAYRSPCVTSFTSWRCLPAWINAVPMIGWKSPACWPSSSVPRRFQKLKSPPIKSSPMPTFNVTSESIISVQCVGWDETMPLCYFLLGRLTWITGQIQNILAANPIDQINCSVFWNSSLERGWIIR